MPMSSHFQVYLSCSVRSISTQVTSMYFVADGYYTTGQLDGLPGARNALPSGPGGSTIFNSIALSHPVDLQTPISVSRRTFQSSAPPWVRSACLTRAGGGHATGLSRQGICRGCPLESVQLRSCGGCSGLRWTDLQLQQLLLETQPRRRVAPRLRLTQRHSGDVVVCSLQPRWSQAWSSLWWTFRGTLSACGSSPADRALSSCTATWSSASA